MAFSDFMTACRDYSRQHNRSLTTEDHLTIQGFDKDYGDRKSMRSALLRALREGGSNHQDLGTVFLLPDNKGRGKPLTGFGPNPPRGTNTLPKPVFVTAKALAPIDTILGGTNILTNEPVLARDVTTVRNVLATRPKAEQLAHARVFEGFGAMVAGKDREIALLKRLADAEEANAKSARENEALLRDIVRSKLLGGEAQL